MTGARSVEELLDRAESCLDDGLVDEALLYCDAALRAEAGHPGAWFVRGDALRMLGELEAAAEAYLRAAQARPDHAASWASHALASVELLRLDAAERSVARALREDPRSAEAWQVRSLLREWRGDYSGAERALRHARWLDPLGHPQPPRLTDAEVDSLVEEALGELHPSVQDYLANVAIVLEELPSEETLRSLEPPGSPFGLLGLFQGPSLRERNHEDPWSLLPPTVVLYRRNLERYAADRAELVFQLKLTLFHEIGHFLGLEEEDLVARGLD